MGRFGLTNKTDDARARLAAWAYAGALGASVLSLRASAAPIAAPLSFGHTTTNNWAGYAAMPTDGGAVSSVSGNWVVPTVTGSNLFTRGSVAFWVGMDGYTNNVVEQIGIVSTNDPNVYTAWFEMYPAASQSIAMTVLVGDTMHAQVDYLGANQYKLSLANLTQGSLFSTVQTSAEGEPRSSGEWIAELPSTRLGDFGSMTFTNASLTLDDATTGGISSFPNDSIDMVPGPGRGGPGAVAGPLDATGTSFTITVPEPVGICIFGLVGVGLLGRRRRASR